MSTVADCGMWREAGHPGDAPFDSATGEGRVEEVDGDYAHARANGLRAIPLLFEVFGGWSPEVDALFGWPRRTFLFKTWEICFLYFSQISHN